MEQEELAHGEYELIEAESLFDAKQKSAAVYFMRHSPQCWAVACNWQGIANYMATRLQTLH